MPCKFESNNCRNQNRRLGWLIPVVVVIIGFHVSLLIWLSFVNSPNIDELAHLPSGISHWKYGKFDLYRVNPPLVRMVAATPILFTDAVEDWSEWNDTLYSRSEFWVGKKFTQNNGFNIFRFYTLARFACIPFSILGCIVSYCWASELYGWKSGLFSLLLYSFSPNLIAWGSSITPDAGATSMGLLATWGFWKWLKRPCWKTVFLSGATLGLALLTKSTWIFSLILFPLIWGIWNYNFRKALSQEKRPPVMQIGVILLLGIYVLNLGYGFEGSFTPLGNYQFISKSLSGKDKPIEGGNRFAGTIFGVILVPLPENYLRGIDVQKYDFEQEKWSYLRGEQKRGGWWYYYVYGFLVKTPLGFQLLVFCSCLSAFFQRFKQEWRLTRDEWVLLIPAVFIFLLVSSQTGFNRYYRYVLPALPFVFIFTSRIVKYSNRFGLSSLIMYGVLFSGVIESVVILPHSLSFFNIAAGGPLAGPQHLLDGNIDWGQDLLFLKKWHDEHPDCRPLKVSYFSDWDIAPEIARIKCGKVPKLDPDSPETFVLSRGWYAISVNQVYGYHYFDYDKPFYEYFRDLNPVDRAGYSIYIYHVE